MTFSLYDAVVPSYLQTLRGTIGWLGKAEEFAATNGKEEAEMMAASLAPDMFPFNRQLRACAMHSQGALEGAFKGVFSPDLSPHPESFAGLQERLEEALAYLEALDRAEVDALTGKPMRFEFGETKWPFTAENFLLSFSQPNYYFHTTTAYAILRNQGMAIGKMDYIGKMRMEG
ncbi:DUF1993 family protein [Alteraurantiacibacter aestuarii]|uniref:DUF1993 family protein n=1 Tax=Alteraurantiacibacter aestuarii TaxID=650004 RepID=A0A844ZPR5_9SPHN|nr:DUF1993 domain-containing protein [Alteraurantiacibacter aestuarii]MXO89040.1 DUF1993 family protein [Alteraurantiacibacter aestuarii]